MSLPSHYDDYISDNENSETRCSPRTNAEGTLAIDTTRITDVFNVSSVVRGASADIDNGFLQNQIARQRTAFMTNHSLGRCANTFTEKCRVACSAQSHPMMDFEYLPPELCAKNARYQKRA